MTKVNHLLCCHFKAKKNLSCFLTVTMEEVGMTFKGGKRCTVPYWEIYVENSVRGCANSPRDNSILPQKNMWAVILFFSHLASVSTYH